MKSFLGDSLIYDFHSALGQMLVYQVNMDIQEPERVLYQAVPETTYERMCRQRVFEVVAERFNVNFLVYEPIQPQLIQWILHNRK